MDLGRDRRGLVASGNSCSVHGRKRKMKRDIASPVTSSAAPRDWEPLERMAPDALPTEPSEARLIEIRERARRDGAVPAKGIRPKGSPFPIASSETGYYAIPLLKPPQWTWEVPVYFFIGGGAGAAA